MKYFKSAEFSQFIGVLTIWLSTSAYICIFQALIIRTVSFQSSTTELWKRFYAAEWPHVTLEKKTRVLEENVNQEMDSSFLICFTVHGLPFCGNMISRDEHKLSYGPKFIMAGLIAHKLQFGKLPSLQMTSELIWILVHLGWELAQNAFKCLLRSLLASGMEAA